MDEATAAGGWSGAVAGWLAGAPAITDGELAAADRLLTGALRRFRHEAERWGQAQVLASLANLAEIRGQYAAALDLLAEAVGYTQALDGHDHAAALLASAGNVLVLLGDYSGARQRHHEALRLAERVGLPGVTALVHNGLGLSARRQGQLDEARGHHQQALAIYDQVDSPSGRAFTHACLGYTAEQGGDLKRAEDHHRDALSEARRAEDPRAIAPAVEGLAGVAAARHDAERCAVLLGAATAIRANTGAPLPAAESLDYDRARDAARDRSTAPAFDRAFDRGQRLALNDACAIADNR